MEIPIQPFVPVPEYFEPNPNEAGWMLGSNGVGVQGGRWTTRENFDHVVQQLTAEVERLKEWRKVAIGETNKLADRNRAIETLQAENTRLKAPVSDEERRTLFHVDKFGFVLISIDGVNDLIHSRPPEPSAKESK